MKRARIINACIFIAIAITLTICVIKEWNNSGAGLWSLIAAAGFYSATFFAVWYVVDSIIIKKL